MINHITIIGKGRVGEALYRLRSTDYGVRGTEDGLRITDYGLRITEDGLRITDYGVRSTEDGGRSTDYEVQETGAKAGVSTVDLISAREFLALPVIRPPSSVIRPPSSVIRTPSSVIRTPYSVIILACKDAYLPDVINRLAEQYGDSLAGSLVLHVNGSLGTDILEPVREHGALVSAAHPFQTFGSADPSALKGIGWGVDCEDDALPLTEEFVKLVGGLPFRLTKTDTVSKRRYHAAAVAASNFTYAAYDLARELAREVGIPEEAFLVPIMQRTLDNAAEAMRNGTPFLLTGPLVRGDVDAVQRQLDAMPAHLREQYIHLSDALKEVITRVASAE